MNKNISKRIKDALLEASTKQKALLICKQWLDKDRIGNPSPVLTEDEAKAIKSSVRAEDVEEYNKWIDVYEIYMNATSIFGLIFEDYQASAEKLNGYLRLWDYIVGEENRLNALYNSIGNKKDAEAMLKVIRKSANVYAKPEIGADGYISLNDENLYKLIKLLAEQVRERYEDAKAVTLITENYARRTQSSQFIPFPVQDAITSIKSDFALQVSERFSRKKYLSRIKKGEKVTEQETRRAVFPCYEEIVVPPEKLNFYKDALSYGK